MTQRAAGCALLTTLLQVRARQRQHRRVHRVRAGHHVQPRHGSLGAHVQRVGSLGQHHRPRVAGAHQQAHAVVAHERSALAATGRRLGLLLVRRPRAQGQQLRLGRRLAPALNLDARALRVRLRVHRDRHELGARARVALQRRRALQLGVLVLHVQRVHAAHVLHQTRHAHRVHLARAQRRRPLGRHGHHRRHGHHVQELGRVQLAHQRVHRLRQRCGLVYAGAITRRMLAR
mmetsp:Transcript_27762/g.89395  ORF Transcript_27762/g.89395 Transcript_27762/m.89395 type:complete len:232 (-) Transcript_27762:547-1242(-)